MGLAAPMQPQAERPQCARSCQGAPCLNGLCQTVSLYKPQKGVEHAATLMPVDKELFWSDVSGNLYRMPREGGASKLVLAEKDYIVQIAFDQGTLFWATLNQGLVRSMALSAVVPTTLAKVSTRPQSIATGEGDTHVYVASHDGEKVVRVPRGGGAPEVLGGQHKDVQFIAANADWVAWTRSPILGPTGGVSRLEKKTGKISSVGENLLGPLGVTIVGSYAYWSNFAATTGSIARVELSAGSIENVANGMVEVLSLTNDGKRVYWGTKGAIWAVPVAGGNAVLLAKDQARPVYLTVDDRWVYWVNQDTGEVMKVAK